MRESLPLFSTNQGGPLLFKSLGSSNYHTILGWGSLLLGGLSTPQGFTVHPYTRPLGPQAAASHSPQAAEASLNRSMEKGSR